MTRRCDFMPIGGGTFTLQNKVLPGVYMNFVSASGGVSAGSRGIASIPAELGWGAEDTIIKMDSGDFNRQAVTVFGYDATAPELLLCRRHSSGQKPCLSTGWTAAAPRLPRRSAASP